MAPPVAHAHADATRRVPVDAIRAHMARSERLPAVVADVGWVSGLTSVRSLGRAGVPVVALDYRPSALGLRSRYGTTALAPPFSDEEAFGDYMVALGDAIGEPVPVIVSTDAALNTIARQRPRLGDRFLYPFPHWEQLEAIQSKRYQLECAEAAGVPVPRTAYPASAAEAVALAKEIGRSVLLKPLDPVGFKELHRVQALRCDSPAEVERAYGMVEPFGPILQDYVPGGDDCLYTLGSYIAADGTALGLFSGRKLRQTPAGIGTCRVGEAVWVDEVVDHGLAILRQMQFHGISQVEFKRDPRDGAYRLIEVNPRLWQWHGLARRCGVDLPLIAYRDMLGEQQQPVRMHGEGTLWAITLIGGRWPAVPALRYDDAIFARDDLRPGAVQLARFARRIGPMLRSGRGETTAQPAPVARPKEG